MLGFNLPRISSVLDDPRIVELLDKSPLFRGIPQKILAPILRESVLISLKRGEELLTPGLLNEHVYIIVAGQLGVHLTPSSQDEPIALLNPGECVGEMSVLVGSTVSAFVIAHTACQLLAIGYSPFWALIKGSNESARNMLNILVQRIRMGNEVLADTMLREDKFPDKKPVIDSQTGLYTRYGMQEKFGAVLQRCTDAQQSLCLILLKVDDEQNLAQTTGELNDELPLHAIAQTILTFLRPGDYAARLGGNKFAILLANTMLPEAYATAERLRVTVRQVPILLPDGSSLHPVTISAGISKANEDDSWDTLIARGNRALERAIKAGSNRISDLDS